MKVHKTPGLTINHVSAKVIRYARNPVFSYKKLVRVSMDKLIRSEANMKPFAPKTKKSEIKWHVAKIFVSAGIFAFGTSLSAASFNCDSASLATEKAICQSKNLSELDKSLAVSYTKALALMRDPSDLKKQQVAWITSARRCGSEQSCIEHAYTTRISELNQLHASIGAEEKQSQAVTDASESQNKQRNESAPANGIEKSESTHAPTSINGGKESKRESYGGDTNALLKSSIGAVLISKKGTVCTPPTSHPFLKYAIEGYIAAPEFQKRFGAVNTSYPVIKLGGSVSDLIKGAEAEGCAIIIAEAEDISLISAEMMLIQSDIEVLQRKTINDALTGVLKAKTLTRPADLLLLEALPPGGSPSYLRTLLERGIQSPEQLAAVSEEIIESGYAEKIELHTLLTFLDDRKDGESKGMTPLQVLKARDEARVKAAEAMRQKAEEEERAETIRRIVAGIILFGGIAIGIYLIYVIIRWFDGLAKKCPSCGEHHAAEIMNVYETGRQGGYKTVTRRDIQRDKNYQQIGTIEREEQVHVTTVYYQDHKRCNKCGHEWVVDYSRTHQG